MNRETLIQVIETKYPKLKPTISEDFDGSRNGIWLRGTENGVCGRDEFPLFDYYAMDYAEIRYVFGVHKEFREFIEERDWFAEWQDAGTIILYQ